MSKILIGIFLVVVILVIIGMVKPLLPMFHRGVGRMPKWVYFLLLLVLIISVPFMIAYLMKKSPAGNPGLDGDGNLEEQLASAALPSAEGEVSMPKDCVILSSDEIWVDNRKIDMEALEEYIYKHVEENLPIRILDDYSSAVFWHRVIDLCTKKGVNFTTEDGTESKN